MSGIAIVILAAEAGGDLLECSGVLAGLAAIDHGAFGGVADAHDEDVVSDGGWHLGHAGGGDGVAIADEEEGG